MYKDILPNICQTPNSRASNITSNGVKSKKKAWPDHSSLIISGLIGHLYFTPRSYICTVYAEVKRQILRREMYRFKASFADHVHSTDRKDSLGRSPNFPTHPTSSFPSKIGFPPYPRQEGWSGRSPNFPIHPNLFLPVQDWVPPPPRQEGWSGRSPNSSPIPPPPSHWRLGPPPTPDRRDGQEEVPTAHPSHLLLPLKIGSKSPPPSPRTGGLVRKKS